MSDDAGEDDESLDEETQERVNRVRGKRDSRPSRRRGRSKQTPEPEQTPQAEQEEQAEQSNKAEQEADEMDANPQTEATQEDKSPQPTQAEQREQTTVSKLEPVTQREHDTYYLDADVREELERVYRRMSLDILEETGVDLDEQRVGGRNRYYRPLALLLGAREIAEMSPGEVRQAIEEEDLIDDLPDSE
ncbi:hypothetical protein [Halorubrum sp. LN27]|uniref:hypothetical protein n=1 Tax=Halorubrum sp. LN27 TaxID=2801032 RepID=UPI001909E2DD|nr:hypothetical protein [Halorubrum sp. LN27]